MKRVIITGPTGAIGIALIQKMIECEVEVVAVCHVGSKRIERIPKSNLVKTVECNLEEISKLSDILDKQYDVFYHFAWACTTGADRDNVDAQLDNLKYTIDAVEVASRLGCKKFIGAGSQAEYGRVEGKLEAKTPTFPENGYGIAKLAAGQLSRLRCEQLGMEHVWTRILSVYGPYDGEKSMIMSFVRKMLQGEKPSCTKGEQIWDYLYSKDAANAFYLIGLKGIHGKTYCLGSGKGMPLREYIEIMRNEINPKQEIGFGDIPYSKKQVMYLCADIEDLKKDTGFECMYSFEEGIKETVYWCKA